MSRDSGGTFTVVNSFVAGTVIKSAEVNTNFTDAGAEITDSLSRSGKGAMLSPLKLSTGSNALPGLAFAADVGAGLWLPATNTVRMVALGANLQQWSPTAVSITPALSAAAGLTVTNSIANGAGITTTGTGSGAGVVAKGGVGDAAGVVGFGDATAPVGSTALGNGGLFIGGTGATIPTISTNAGVYAIGGVSSSSGIGGIGVVGRGGETAVTAAGVGAVFIGGAPTAGNLAGGNGVNAFGGAASGTGTSGVGVAGTGGFGSAGGTFANGTAATAGTRRTALAVTNGDISLAGVTAPSSSVGLANVVTPINPAKAWANVTTNGAGAVTVNDACNLTASVLGSNLSFTFPVGGTMANASYAVELAKSDEGTELYVVSQTTGGFVVGAYTYVLDGGGTAVVTSTVSFAITARRVHATVHGRQ